MTLIYQVYLSYLALIKNIHANMCKLHYFTNLAGCTNQKIGNLIRYGACTITTHSLRNEWLFYVLDFTQWTGIQPDFTTSDICLH